MEEFSLIQAWGQMSMVVKGLMLFMLAQSAFVLVVVIERAVTFSRASKQTYSYVLALREYLNKRRIDEALSAARRHDKSPVATVVGSGLEAYRHGREALDMDGPEDIGDFDIVDSVNRALERVKERETAKLRKGLGGLATTSSVAPFVGLLTTVIGIINAFKLLEQGGGIETIGPAMAEALYGTALGLLVAVPSAMFFNYYSGRVDSMIVDMDDVSSEFIDYVLKEGRV
jgi:biopolymer transport protein ExbB/TolQ